MRDDGERLNWAQATGYWTMLSVFFGVGIVGVSLALLSSPFRLAELYQMSGGA
jgi:hypothetical protein